MNILLITMVNIKDIRERGIYHDLMRSFIKKGHSVYVVSPAERRSGEATSLTSSDNCSLLRVKIGNIQKTNLIEKGITTLTLERKIKRAINKYFTNVKFDAVLYSTPPITLCKVIEYIKKRDGAFAYLMLKDIFPQNAVDLGIFSKKSPFYVYFHRKEKKLYKISDMIGCMSEANVKYLLNHCESIVKGKIEVCPNGEEPQDTDIIRSKREETRLKYGLPLDARIFVYGGNIGLPQGAEFIIDVLKAFNGDKKNYFVIPGAGTEYGKIEKYRNASGQENLLLLPFLPYEEYSTLLSASDVGLIFLDHRFTIPNFPSRILTYMQSYLPVIAATDSATDIGYVIESGDFGYRCDSGDVSAFKAIIDGLSEDELIEKGKNARKYFEEHYTADAVCDIILKSTENSL